MFLANLHRDLKVSLIAVAAFAVVMATACSDDKSPPDDGKDGKGRSSKTMSSCDARFRICAEEILGTSGLATDERESLAGCEFAKALPRTSSEDLFEVARATIKAHCL